MTSPYHRVGEVMSSLSSNLSDEQQKLNAIMYSGDGATADALHSLLGSHAQGIGELASHADKDAGTAQVQAGVDDELTRHASPEAVEQVTNTFKAIRANPTVDASTKARVYNDMVAVQRDRNDAVQKHEINTTDNFTEPSTLERYTGGSGEGYTPFGGSGGSNVEEMPGTLGVGENGGNSGGGSSNGGSSNGGGTGGSETGGAGSTHLSADTDTLGRNGSTSAQPGAGMQPQQGAQPGAGAQPQGAQPGAGGGPTGLGADMSHLKDLKPLPKDKKKKKDDDLTYTGLSGGDGNTGSGVGAVPIDRGASIQGGITKSNTSGVNAPAVSATGAPPGAGGGQQGGMAGRGGMMGGGMGSGAGMGGSSKAKERPDIKSADPAQHGMTEVENAVDAGTLGRKTAEKPTLEDELDIMPLLDKGKGAA